MLEPPRRFFLVTEARLASIPSARRVPLVASPELLGYEVLALVPFDDLEDGRPESPTP